MTKTEIEKHSEPTVFCTCICVSFSVALVGRGNVKGWGSEAEGHLILWVRGGGTKCLGLMV